MRKETKKKVRILGAVLFFLYLLALTYFLFFAEGYGRSVEGRMYAYNLQPFREIKRFWVHREMLGTFAVFCNLAGNVIGFIPFGMILPVIWPKTGKVLRILLLSFEFSLCVETIQLVWMVGSCDVDDLILNTLGGVIGYMLFWICNKIRRKIYG